MSIIAVFGSGRPLAPHRALVALALVLTGCGNLLDVRDPTVVTPDQLKGPTAVPNAVASVVGDFQEAFDDYVRYSALFTDEMILAGTFPTRIDVDERNVQLDPDNGTITADLFTPLQVSRASADQGLMNFRDALGDPDFSEVESDLREGIALAGLYGGYIREFMAELYCQAVLEPKAVPLTSDAVAEAALERLQDAEADATDAGGDDVAMAARVGQARALLWLGRYDEAAAIAATVPEDFVYFAEYSDNQPAQFNEIFSFSTGTTEALRWTVGDGRAGNRHNERWPYLNEWIAQGLLVKDPPGYKAADIGVPVVLQLLYDDGARPIVLASGWEAQMIIAEKELREGATQAAQDRINARLADPSTNPMLRVNPTLSFGPFQPVAFTGSPATDLPQLARARSAGLWLSGERQGTLRRFLEADGVNLYPQGTQGNDDSFPIVRQEIDNNPNVNSGCGG